MKIGKLKVFLFPYVLLKVAVAKIHYSTLDVVSTPATTHSPRVIDKTCLLRPDAGPCRGEIPMYYYDPGKKSCSVFVWGGCQGNGNRFDTMKKCYDSCWSKPSDIKSRPKFCKLSFDYGFCFGDLKRWYYDHVWKTCKETIYSGCGGNKNNFYGLEQCEAICLFGNARVQMTDNKRDLNKILVINPDKATPKRGKQQTSSF